MDAARTLQQANNGKLQLSDEDELELLERMSAGLTSMKTKALIADPKRYERHFL